MKGSGWLSFQSYLFCLRNLSDFGSFRGTAWSGKPNFRLSHLNCFRAILLDRFPVVSVCSWFLSFFGLLKFLFIFLNCLGRKQWAKSAKKSVNSAEFSDQVRALLARNSGIPEDLDEHRVSLPEEISKIFIRKFLKFSWTEKQLFRTFSSWKGHQHISLQHKTSFNFLPYKLRMPPCTFFLRSVTSTLQHLRLKCQAL